MDFFLVLTFLFAIGSILGWIIELFYRRLSGGKWINPGFLNGPYLPLYGFGMTLMFLIAIIPLDSISPVWLMHTVRLIIICIVMTFIEYIAGLIFIKGMGIKLWDYSSRWGNIQGIICPLFSLFWTLIGAIYVFFLHPIVYNAVKWFTNNLYYSFFVGVFFGLFMWDFASTMKLSSILRKFAKENKISIKYEELKDTIRNYQKLHKLKNSFVNPFKATTTTLQESLKKHIENIKADEHFNVINKIKKRKRK